MVRASGIRASISPAGDDADLCAYGRARYPEPLNPDTASVLAALKKRSSKAVRDGMARYAVPSDHAYGVAVKDIRALGKELGRDHELALALWETGVYEARMLVAFVGDPEKLTSAQMDQWCREFDNWAFCDALSFHLFDRSPHAWKKVEQWSRRKGEFEKRTAFALLWALALHDKAMSDERLREGLRLIEREAADKRNFVKKAVDMALRAIARRRTLAAAAAETAERVKAARRGAK